MIYVAGTMSALFAAAMGFIWLQNVWLEDSFSELRDAQANLRSCAARIENIKEDVESDAKANNLDNFVVPSEWMLP